MIDGSLDVKKLSFPKVHNSWHDFNLNELIRDIKASGSNLIFDTSKPEIKANYTLPDGTQMDYTKEASHIPGNCLDIIRNARIWLEL